MIPSAVWNKQATGNSFKDKIAQACRVSAICGL